MSCSINVIRNPLLDLSTDIKEKIISNLHDRNVINTLFLVCNKDWLEVVRDEDMWKERAICQLGQKQSEVWYQSCGGNWKKVCQTLSKKGLVYSDRCERGIFKNGMLDGKGKRDLANGIKEIGIFKAGQLQEGEIIYPDGVQEKGKFVNGKLHGRDGIRIYDDGSTEEGEFEDGELNGQGLVRWGDGVEEIGIFKAGQLQEGEIIYPDGSKEEGEFEDGKLNGPGRIYWGNGVFWEGQFRDGQLDGRGQIFIDNENECSLVRGVFEQGNLVEEHLCKEEYFSDEDKNISNPIDLE